MTRPRPSQVDVPPGHILSRTIAQDHSACRAKPGLNREFKVINTEVLRLKPTVEELAGGWWTDWQRQWQREEEQGGSVGGKRSVPEVRENKTEPERVWQSETERGSVKEVQECYWCVAERRKSVVWCRELGELTVVDFCLNDRHKNNSRWCEWRVVTVLWMSPSRTLWWGITQSLRVLPALYWTTITQRWPQTCLRRFILHQPSSSLCVRSTVFLIAGVWSRMWSKRPKAQFDLKRRHVQIF